MSETWTREINPDPLIEAALLMERAARYITSAPGFTLEGELHLLSHLAITTAGILRITAGGPETCPHGIPSSRGPFGDGPFPYGPDGCPECVAAVSERGGEW